MDDSLYHKFFDVEDRHWWFTGRQEIVLGVIRKRLGKGGGRTALDVGCGTGAFMKALSAEWDVWGSDVSPIAVEYAKKRGLKNVIQGTLDALLPIPDHYSLITLLDVIEHIDNDVAVLRQAASRLATDGILIVTVPAYPWLWTSHDDVNHHKRRYTRATLVQSLTAAGLTIESVSYLNTLLFPLALVNRMLSKITGRPVDDGLTVPPKPLNSALRSMFAFERHLLPGTAMPFGLSLLAVTRRTEKQ